MALLQKTAIGWHELTNPILDFVIDRRPPILRVGEMVRKFWREFERLEKQSPYNTLNVSQCWAPFEVPWTGAEKSAQPKVKKGGKGRVKRYATGKRM
jgi:hypothetical protein